jgi:hypothetical protein
MKKRIIVHFALIGLIGLIVTAQSAKADVVLADWCVNLNGNIKIACNIGVLSPSAGGIDLSHFDQTLSPDPNGLGSISVTLSQGDNQYVSFYADYDILFGQLGSFDDSGNVIGALPAGVSFELDDPNTSNIFADFAANALANMNNVGTPSGPPNECCDVSFALSLGNINVGAAGATATFVIGSTAPSGGFYIQQTNSDSPDSIYLQGTVTDNGAPPAVPEPSTLALGLASVFLVAWRHFRTAR